MAEDPQRLRVKRRSCRGSITKLLSKVEDALSCELTTINSDTVAESQRLAFNTTLGQLKLKKDLIIKLDSDISYAIKEEEELETELNDADAYLMELEQKMVILEEFVKRACQPPVIPKQDTHLLTSHPPSTDMMAQSMPETEVVKKPTGEVADAAVTNSTGHVSADNNNLPINSTPTTQTHIRLPKSTLPTFNGNPLKWQTFWDSFTAAVHSNPSLSPVQKFGYLRAQLEGDAARAISGLPLTDDNYVHSVAF